MSKKSLFTRLALLAAPVLAPLSSFAQAVIPDPLPSIQSLATSSSGIAPVFFALAVVSVGIMIGVKWIKRAGHAA